MENDERTYISIMFTILNEDGSDPYDQTVWTIYESDGKDRDVEACIEALSAHMDEALGRKNSIALDNVQRMDTIPSDWGDRDIGKLER